MLPKPVQPEHGSRKVLNGVEVWTRHNFTTENGNIYETIDGSYILSNGQPVQDKTILEFLPEEHRQKALTWWESWSGEESPPLGPKLTKAEIMAQIQSLQATADSMLDDEGTGVEMIPVGQTSEKTQDQTSNEPKRQVGRPKLDKGIETLKQMGIGT